MNLNPLQWLPLNPNTQWALGGCVMLGLSSGILSSFAMLRKRSLLGDALAHASLPGICVAFMLTGQRSIPVFMIGALASGIAGALLIQAITQYSRIKEDTALGLVLSTFFAFGILLLTKILHSEGGVKAGLDKFLFGQAAAMVGTDVQIMFGCAALVCLISLAFYKEFKLLCFDPQFADGMGFSSTSLDRGLNMLIVLIVVVGLQAVGVVLMVAMLITPAAAARFWTNRLGRMAFLSALIGALSGALGTFFSTLKSGLATGPLIVLSCAILFLASLFFAPNRGLLARVWRVARLRRKVARENVLRAIYEHVEPLGNYRQPFTTDLVAQERSLSHRSAQKQLSRLAQEDMIHKTGDGFFLTDRGLSEAYLIVRNHRLWEMFLMHEDQLGADHVDRDADMIEHFLPQETIMELEKLLEIHGLDLRLPQSVHPIDQKLETAGGAR